MSIYLQTVCYWCRISHTYINININTHTHTHTQQFAGSCVSLRLIAITLSLQHGGHNCVTVTPFIALGNSPDKLRHPRSGAYSAEQVLLNKQQIWGGEACLKFYLALKQVRQNRRGWFLVMCRRRSCCFVKCSSRSVSSQRRSVTVLPSHTVSTI